MTINLKAFISSPEWGEISIPDWFKERTEALTAQLGDDNPELQLFKEILASGRIEEDAVVRADALAGATQNSDVFLLAVDIAAHSLNTMLAIAQLVPLRLKAAA